jgi:GxxExxY protein
MTKQSTEYAENAEVTREGAETDRVLSAHERRELPAEINRLSEQVLGAAIEVHRSLGPGLLERLYEEALVHELRLRGIAVESQAPVSLWYKGLELVGQRLDLLVERLIVLELKSVERVAEAHLSQMLGYMRAGNFPLGLLINFNVPVLVRGIHRRINSRALIPSPTPKNSASSA